MSAVNVSVIAPEGCSSVFFPSLGKELKVKPGETYTATAEEAEQLKAHGWKIKGEYTKADIDRLAGEAMAKKKAEDEAAANEPTHKPQKPKK